MKKSFVVLIFIANTAAAMDIECNVKDRLYSRRPSKVHISNVGTAKATFSVLKGKLAYELAAMNSELSLMSSTTSQRTGWATSVYETGNSDDTNFLITVTTSGKTEQARANIQVLTDGLDGGTRSLALECTQAAD